MNPYIEPKKPAETESRPDRNFLTFEGFIQDTQLLAQLEREQFRIFAKKPSNLNRT